MTNEIKGNIINIKIVSHKTNRTILNKSLSFKPKSKFTYEESDYVLFPLTYRTVSHQNWLHFTTSVEEWFNDIVEKYNQLTLSSRSISVSDFQVGLTITVYDVTSDKWKDNKVLLQVNRGRVTAPMVDQSGPYRYYNPVSETEHNPIQYLLHILKRKYEWS